MSRKPALHFTLMASLLLSIVILLTIQACNSADNTAQTSSEDTNTPGIEKPLGKHTQAPNFTLPDLDGVNHNLHDWIGKVIVLNF